MGYTISWHPMRFTDFTYQSVVDAVKRVLSPGFSLGQESWGFIISDDANSNDSIGFLRDGQHQTCWEKTNRRPYTMETMKALIIMVEFGVTLNLDHDDEDMTWYIDALVAVNEKYPLESYERQKQYFMELEAKKKGELGI